MLFILHVLFDIFVVSSHSIICSRYTYVYLSEKCWVLFFYHILDTSFPIFDHFLFKPMNFMSQIPLSLVIRAILSPTYYFSILC